MTKEKLLLEYLSKISELDKAIAKYKSAPKCEYTDFYIKKLETERQIYFQVSKDIEDL